MIAPLRTLKQAYDARQDEEVLKNVEIPGLISAFTVTAGKPDIENVAETIARRMTEYGVTTYGHLQSLSARVIGRMGVTELQATRLRKFLGEFTTVESDESDEEVRKKPRCEIAKASSQPAKEGRDVTEPAETMPQYDTTSETDSKVQEPPGGKK